MLCVQCVLAVLCRLDNTQAEGGCCLDHLALFALGFTQGQLLLQQLHPPGQLLVPEAEAVHFLLLLPQALVPLLQLFLFRIRRSKTS